MVATLALVFVVVVIIAGAVVANAFREDDDSAGPAPDQSGSPEPSSSQEPEEPSEEPSSEEDEDLLNPGWERAKSSKWGFVYEVPESEGWVFQGPAAFFGVGSDEEDMPEVAMSGVSYYETSPCEADESLAVAGAQGITETEDTEEMAEGVSMKWAELYYETEKGGQPEVALRSVEEFSANGLEGHYGIAEADPAAVEDECAPEGGVVHTVVVPNRDEADEVRAFSIIADTGYDNSLDSDTIETILNSLRDSETDG